MATSSSTPDRSKAQNDRDTDQAATKADKAQDGRPVNDPDAGRTPDTLPKQ
jgi:hypothetical protein